MKVNKEKIKKVVSISCFGLAGLIALLGCVAGFHSCSSGVNATADTSVIGYGSNSYQLQQDNQYENIRYSRNILINYSSGIKYTLSANSIIIDSVYTAYADKYSNNFIGTPSSIYLDSTQHDIGYELSYDRSNPYFKLGLTYTFDPNYTAGDKRRFTYQLSYVFNSRATQFYANLVNYGTYLEGESNILDLQGYDPSSIFTFFVPLLDVNLSASYDMLSSIGTAGDQESYDAGYQVGYENGKSDAGGDELVDSIFTNIFKVGVLPVQVLMSIFNFELFGINMTGIVKGLLTALLILFVVRLIMGGKNNE